MKTATYIRSVESWRSDARVYRLSEPLEGADLVIVSAVDADSGPETFIFPTDEKALENDDATSFIELNGSFRGALDHERALNNAGYGVSVPEEPEPVNG